MILCLVSGLVIVFNVYYLYNNIANRKKQISKTIMDAKKKLIVDDINMIYNII